MSLNLDSPLDELSGIGEKTKQLFHKVGVENVGDLLNYFPRTYDQFTEPISICALKEGETFSVSAELTLPISNRYLHGRCISSARCSDGTGELLLTWYHMPYLKNSLNDSTIYIFRGKISRQGNLFVMEQPSIFSPEQYQMKLSALQPVYTLTKGLTENIIHKAVRQVLKEKSLTEEYFPEEILETYHLCSYREAIIAIHFPKDTNELQTARRRLVFDEFFFFLLQLSYRKKERENVRNFFHIKPKGTADLVISALPYQLTGAQVRVWNEIQNDLQKESVMERLIQGDVGSGKTIIAVLALLTVAENGYQGALMAPTEVLARQHYETVSSLLASNHLSFQVDLLTGSLNAKQKREVYARTASGENSILIGTHALIQDKVMFKNLALVITDEQHRFGVRQREDLSRKGNLPHTIVMSATPIPRTLAGILYNDMDMSVIDEMPSDRLPVKSCVVGPKYRDAAYRFIRDQVREGHQAYVICPMIEESDSMEAENVIAYADSLRRKLPDDICIEYMHGRMKPAEKNEIMEGFLKNEIQVLVSTTVVEVGVNVPNATVMLIENAERFGLAQLHQLRGRVGRSSAQSYCIFLYTTENKKNKERLEILKQSNDGFQIAEKDMQLRGPGDLLGVRQSGFLSFAIADIYADSDMLKIADEAVKNIITEDLDLSLFKNKGLRERRDQYVKSSHFVQ